MRFPNVRCIWWFSNVDLFVRSCLSLSQEDTTLISILRVANPVYFLIMSILASWWSYIKVERGDSLFLQYNEMKARKNGLSSSWKWLKSVLWRGCRILLNVQQGGHVIVSHWCYSEAKTLEKLRSARIKICFAYIDSFLAFFLSNSQSMIVPRYSLGCRTWIGQILVSLSKVGRAPYLYAT